LTCNWFITMTYTDGFEQGAPRAVLEPIGTPP
jgi:hypothetical protein